MKRLPNWLGQDIIYNRRNGKTKTIKHIHLGITTKRKTGSRFILDFLNCLGHSISYDEVNNVETLFAELNDKNQINRSVVPKDVHPLSFVMSVYDNCDYNPEMLSAASFHVTNGINIQLLSKTEELEQPISSATPEFCPKRSFKPVMKDDVQLKQLKSNQMKLIKPWQK